MSSIENLSVAWRLLLLNRKQRQGLDIFLRDVLSKGRVWGVEWEGLRLIRSMAQGVCQAAQTPWLPWAGRAHPGPALNSCWADQSSNLPVNHFSHCFGLEQRKCLLFRPIKMCLLKAKLVFTSAGSSDLGHLEMVPKSHHPSLEQGSDFPLGWCTWHSKPALIFPLAEQCNLLLHNLSSVLLRVSGLICWPVIESILSFWTAWCPQELVINGIPAGHLGC